MTTFTTEDRVAVKTGEDMSTRSHGMVGKAYRSASEAFRDADYAESIERPKKYDYSGFGGFLLAMLFVAIFAYGFWMTIGRL